MAAYTYEIGDNVNVTRERRDGHDTTVIRIDREDAGLAIELGENVYVSDLLSKLAAAWTRTDVE